MFLGMELSITNAETGLHTTFALLVVAVFGVLCSTFCFFKARKRSRKMKYAESIKMDS